MEWSIIPHAFHFYDLSPEEKQALMEEKKTMIRLLQRLGNIMTREHIEEKHKSYDAAGNEDVYVTKLQDWSLSPESTIFCVADSANK